MAGLDFSTLGRSRLVVAFGATDLKLLVRLESATAEQLAIAAEVGKLLSGAPTWREACHAE